MPDLMPLLVCHSHGGPYEDEAFLAGISVGHVDCVLGLQMSQVVTQTVRTDLLPQLDLVAMRHGFTMTRVPFQGGPNGDWAMVVFARGETL